MSLENDLHDLADDAHRGIISPEEHDRQYALLIEAERLRRSAGYLLMDGVPVCPGVVCKCHEPRSFCPMHGKTVR